jgi:hypothetical protein
MCVCIISLSIYLYIEREQALDFICGSVSGNYGDAREEKRINDASVLEQSTT